MVEFSPNAAIFVGQKWKNSIPKMEKLNSKNNDLILAECNDICGAKKKQYNSKMND